MQSEDERALGEPATTTQTSDCRRACEYDLLECPSPSRRFMEIPSNKNGHVRGSVDPGRKYTEHPSASQQQALWVAGMAGEGGLCLPFSVAY